MPLTRKTATPWNSVHHFRFSCLSCATHVSQHKHHHLPTWQHMGGGGGVGGACLRWVHVALERQHQHIIINTSTHPHIRTSTLTYTSTSSSSNMRTYRWRVGGACLRWVHVALERQHQHIIINTSTHRNIRTPTVTYTSTSPSVNMRTYGGVGGACSRWVRFVRRGPHWRSR